MPNHGQNETEDEFIQRCMSETISEGKDKEQAYAICKSKWDRRNMSKSTKNVLNYLDIQHQTHQRNEDQNLNNG